MKKTYRLFGLFLVLLLASSACQQTQVLPSETDASTEAPSQDAAEISADNVEMMTEVYSASVNSGAISATWAADSSAVWIEDGFSATLYDSTTGEMTAQFNPGEYAAIYDLSADGKTAAYSQDGMEIRLYDVFSQADVLTITPDFPYSSAFFNSDGSLLGAASMNDIQVVLWDATNGEEKAVLSGFETAAPVYDASFGADGKILIWFSRGTVQTMQVASQEMGPILSHEDFVTDHTLSPNGKVVATTAAATIGGKFLPALTLWDADSGEILRQIAKEAYYSSIAFSADSSLIAVGSEDTVVFFSVPHGDEVYQFDNGEAIVNLAFSPDGSKLITCGNSGTITLYMVEE